MEKITGSNPWICGCGFARNLNMNSKTFLIPAVYGLIAFVILPWIFIALNNFLHLPTFYFDLTTIFGAALIVVGIFLALYTFILFFSMGNGMPLPTHPTHKLMTKEMYNFTRNPIYLSYFFIVLGIAFLLGQLLLFIYFLLFVGAVHFWVTSIEEKELEKKFGEEYQRYLKKVPRYLPFLF